jgi:protein-S-isoprenylcysteine O-methyltransferase Ste14
MSQPPSKQLLPRIITGVFSLLVFILLWFGVAGRITWWTGWIFLLAFIIFVSILVWRLSKADPELLQERNRPADAAEDWDRRIMGAYTVFLVVLLLITALDGGRYGWSTVPLGVQLLGWSLLVMAGWIVWQVMVTNAYLSSWARLQDDRGQVVVQEGLYRTVRHPMYLGIILAFLGLPLALGSYWALVPGIIIGGLFIYRTYREDQLLVAGLEGYDQYAQKVKHRLLPGIW